MKNRMLYRALSLLLLLALLSPVAALATDSPFASFSAVDKASYNSTLYTEAPQGALPLADAFSFALSAVCSKYGVSEDSLYGRYLSYGYCGSELACQNFPFWQFDLEPVDGGLGYHVLVSADTGVVLCLQSTGEITGIDNAKDMLTEVYGWYAEDLTNFMFETTGVDIVLCWPKEHPDWVYSFNFNIPHYEGCKTPFQTDFTGYPGENGARDLLRGLPTLLADRTQESRSALVQRCTDCGVELSAERATAILQGDMTSAEVARALFESCYGNESHWNACHCEWLDELLQEIK